MSLWFKCPKPNPKARMRLFCFPYAGGGTAIFRLWPDRLRETVEVCPVILPGRESRIQEAPYTQILRLVSVIESGLLPHLDKPFAFFGHSMGAIISFELSRLLQTHHDLEPVHLYVSGRRAPRCVDREPPTYNLPEPEFISELKRLKGTPEEALEHPELMEMILPLLRADFEACQTYSYSPGPLLNCPISAYGGVGDDDVKREDLEGWGQETAGKFKLIMLPGDHFFLNTASETLLSIIGKELHEDVARLF